MAVKKLIFNQVVGMNHDLSPSKRDGKYAYEIKNMRVTIEEGNSLMSWSNEKGTKEIKVFNEGGEAKIEGHVMGECILNNYWVLFSHKSNTELIIYRLDFTNPDNVICVELFRGNLHMSLDNKMETLGVLERTDILKVYWIDGINQPRFINIVSETIDAFDTTLFDFLPTDTQLTSINIEKVYESGRFKAGTILYAFSYYNYYGALTNLFYISPIQYVSNNNIGNEVDRHVSCAFKITISNANSKFDTLRIFSIFRASEDTVPQVSIVKDLDLSLYNSGSIEFTDLGDSNTTIDYALLLFMNNLPISSYTMDSKDNTLFLGNFKYTSLEDEDLKILVKQAFNNLNKNNFFVLVAISTDDSKQYYPYKNQLKNPSNVILGFKGGEEYFFGCVLLDINNRWTSILPLGTITNNKYPKVEKAGNDWITSIVQANVTSLTQSINSILLSANLLKQYKAIKYVIVSKNDYQRNIICQGVLNPTVYCYEDRFHDITPYALSSWFFRPIMKRAPYLYNSNLINSYATYEGGVLEYRHWCSLPHLPGPAQVENWKDNKWKNALGKTLISNIPVEILSNDDSSWYYFGNGGIKTYPALVDKLLSTDTINSRSYYGVDLNILTFHSPDIEFNSSVLETLDRSNNEYKLTIVGHSVVSNTVSDYEVETTNNSYMEVKHSRYTYKTLVNLNKASNKYNSSYPAAGFVNPWGVKTIEYDSNIDLGGASKDDLNKKTGWYSCCTVFPWNRSTSLNEQPYKVSGETPMDWTVPLKTKVMSNLRFCMKTTYGQNINYNLSNINICDPLTKLVRIGNIKDPYNNEVSYYSNIDTLLTKESYSNYRWLCEASKTSYPTYTTTEYQPANMNMEIDRDLSNKMGDPIRMKYSSTAHAVFGLLYTGGKQLILPHLSGGSDNFLSTFTKPTWITKEMNNPYKDELIIVDEFAIVSAYLNMEPWKMLMYKDALVNENLDNSTNTEGGSSEDDDYNTDSSGNPRAATRDADEFGANVGESYVSLADFYSRHPEFMKSIVADIVAPFIEKCVSRGLIKGLTLDNWKEYIGLTPLPNSPIYILLVLGGATVKPNYSFASSKEEWPTPEWLLLRYGYNKDNQLEISIASAILMSVRLIDLFKIIYRRRSDGFLVINSVTNDDGTRTEVNDVEIKEPGTPSDPNPWPPIAGGGGALNPNGNGLGAGPGGSNTGKYDNSGNSADIESLRAPSRTGTWDEDDVTTGNLLINSPTYDTSDDGIFFIGELRRVNPYIFSTDEYNLQNYNWQGASNTIYFNDSNTHYSYGDTYFQRYDCLKTFPSTPEDPNQIVDIGSFMLETYVNIDGRWDRNRGLLSNINITNTNFNQLNKAYTLKDKFNYTYVNEHQFDHTEYPNSVMWTLTKVFGEPIDSWTHLTSTSILDLDGDEGWLEKILNFQNSLLFFQADGVGLIRYNENVLISTNSGVPVELANSGKVDGKVYYNKEIGCQNKDTIAVSKNAVYFIDGHTKTIYQIKQPQGLQSPTALSDGTFETFMKELNIDIEKSFYNRNTLDIYFTFPNNSAYSCLTYNELMQGFTSFYDYKAPFINNIINSCYHITNEVDPITNARRAFIWKQNAGMYNYYYAHKVEEDFNNPDDDWYGGLYGPFYMTVVANGEQNDSLVDKIYDNLEFRSDSWDIQGNLLPTTFNKLNTWNEYQTGSNTLTRYGVWTNPDNTTKVSVDNPSTLKKKFRIWRANFPRAGYWRSDDKARPVKPVTLPSETVDIPGFRAPTYIIKRTRDRIRNPWTYVQLLMSTPNHDKTTLHDMTVLYFDNSGVR